MEAQLRSVRIVAIGFGGSGPATIPGPDGRPLEEAGKGPIRVALDPGPLKAAAQAAGGRYLDANDGGLRATLVSELAREAKGGTRTVLRVKDQSPTFTLIALAALVARIVAGILATAKPGRDPRKGEIPMEVHPGSAGKRRGHRGGGGKRKREKEQLGYLG
jgi:hypothetical protein